MSKKLSVVDYQRTPFRRIEKDSADPQSVPSIISVTPKTEGARNSGKYTAVVKQPGQKRGEYQTSLIKNGQSIHVSNVDNYAEIFAETINSRLFAKLAPNAGVSCQPVIGPDGQEIYVQSFFPKSRVTAGHEVGGHSRRGFGAGVRRLAASVAGKDSMIKRLKTFNIEHGHTLEIGIVTSLLLGNDDLHSANFGKEDASGHFKFFDYGKSGHKLSAKMRVPGRQMGLHNFFIKEPTYHDWDFGRKFFESPHYLKAIHDVLQNNKKYANTIEDTITHAVGDILRQVAHIEKENNLQAGSEQTRALQAYAEFLGLSKQRKQITVERQKRIIIASYTNIMENRIKSLRDTHDVLLLPTLSRMLKKPLTQEETGILSVSLRNYVAHQQSKHKPAKIAGVPRNDLLNLISAIADNSKQNYVSLKKAHDFMKFIHKHERTSVTDVILMSKKNLRKLSAKVQDLYENTQGFSSPSFFSRTVKKYKNMIDRKSAAGSGYSSQDNPIHYKKISP